MKLGKWVQQIPGTPELCPRSSKDTVQGPQAAKGQKTTPQRRVGHTHTHQYSSSKSTGDSKQGVTHAHSLVH